MEDSYETRLAAIRTKFLELVGPRLTEAENHLRAADPGSPQVARDVHRIIHQLRGNAGMLGCYELDRELYPMLPLSEYADAEGRGFRPDEAVRIAAGIIAARAAAERDATKPPAAALREGL